MLYTLLILLAVALLVSAIGWKKFIYFISIGYGYSITAIAIAVVVMHYGLMHWYDFVIAAILALYGIRLATFLLVRELKSKAYKKVLDANSNQNYPIPATIAIWVSCALLYLCQASPLTFRVLNGSESPVWAYIGIVVSLLGIGIESLADYQKSAAKRVAPDRFVSTGLYRFVRCPNYFGEILMWTGVFLSGIGCYNAWWQWVMVLFGYLGIVYIMFSGARRIELKQDKSYGSDADFQAYIKRTPIILPLIPIYSVKKLNWLRG